MFFEDPSLFLYTCGYNAEKECVYVYYIFLIVVIDFVCLQRLATDPLNWAFEERTNFGVFLWIVITMILCCVVVLPLMFVLYGFFTI